MPYPRREFAIAMVFTDSRRKNFDDYLDESLVLVQAFSGHGLRDIIEKSQSFISDFRPTCVLYIGGTCDLTTKDRITKMISPSLLTYADLCSHMISLFREARQRVTELFPDLRIAFGGLCGVNLNKYNGMTHFDPIQPVIDSTIETLNYAIKADNVRHDINHPTLTS